MNKLISFSVAFAFLSGCVSIANNLSEEQIGKLTTCEISLSKAKENLKKAGFALEKGEGIFSEWKKDPDLFWDAQNRGGIFRRYEVKELGKNKIQWTEHQASDPESASGKSTTNDFYGISAHDLKRQQAARERVCGAKAFEYFKGTSSKH